ncbi:glycosyltransferase [Danxiaibacter flavus]|uniref:Glycosyltransferase n=1 Tax=Danxiaibacter flavus TaxID=3049108 RepID=A0ABV3ZNN1_9BACT|nr:glycosyltransferase [Chitinophagaceae bacterium DXS]
MSKLHLNKSEINKSAISVTSIIVLLPGCKRKTYNLQLITHYILPLPSMRIAVIKQTGESEDVSYQNYVADIIVSIQQKHGYKLLNYSSLNKKEALPENAIVMFECDQQSQITLQWWYEISLPSIVKKTGIDLLIHLNGCLSLSVKQPQILFIPAIDLLLQPAEKKALPQQIYSKKKLRDFVEKAVSVIVYSEFARNIVMEHAAPDTRVHVLIPSASAAFKPVEWEEKEQVKHKLTEENEYFIAMKKMNNEEELILLLKAFSVFKKWQQSSMKLLLQSGELLETDTWKEKLASYKYRKDVKVLNAYDGELSTNLACSYAGIHLSSHDGHVQPLVEAMQCEIPVITNPLNSFKEIAGESALYQENDDAEVLGHNLVRMYKNEQMRNMLIYNARLMITHYNYNSAVNDMTNIIEASSGQKL